MSFSFNIDLALTTLNSQPVCNAIWWAFHSILTSLWWLWTLSLCVMPIHELFFNTDLALTTLNSQCLHNAISWAFHSIPTLLHPLWTLKMCVMPFQELFIQCWLSFNSQQVHHVIFFSLSFNYWPHSGHFDPQYVSNSNEFFCSYNYFSQSFHNFNSMDPFRPLLTLYSI